MSKSMVQVFEYNSEKNAFQVLYNFEMQDSLPPCSESKLNKIYEVTTTLSTVADSEILMHCRRSQIPKC